MEIWKKEYERIQARVDKLPPKAQQAFWWSVVNYEELRHICEISHVTPQELEEYYEFARKTEDYSLVALLAIYEVINRTDKGTGERAEDTAEIQKKT